MAQISQLEKDFIRCTRENFPMYTHSDCVVAVWEQRLKELNEKLTEKPQHLFETYLKKATKLDRKIFLNRYRTHNNK